MAPNNIRGITDSAELARVEEQISKKKAAWLFESGRLDELTPGSFVKHFQRFIERFLAKSMSLLGL